MKPTLIFAGGGTGGHVFPMIAVADAMQTMADVRIVYVGTSRGIEARILPSRGDTLECLDILPIKGQGARGAVRGLVRAATVLPEARRILARHAPRAVLAVGGYAAGPIGFVAGFSRVPLAILEPNSVLGLSNRWLAPFVARAYLAFPETTGRWRAGAARYAGVPLRGRFVPSPYPLAGAHLRVLVLGGSQGARVLNEVLPEALARASREVLGLSVLHQTGRGQDDEVRRRYDACGLAQVRVTPFLDDVAGELENADLVIARSGAGSVAELCAVGRPAVLVPFPFAADDHQRKNAEALARAGGAVVVAQVEASVDRLAREVIALGRDPKARARMAERSRTQGRPEAAREIARDLLALAGIAERRGNGAPRDMGPGDDLSPGAGVRGASSGRASAGRRSSAEREVAHV